MPRALLLILCALLAYPLSGQRITLHHMMGFHSLDDTAIDRQLRRVGWRYHGVQQDVLRKPRMYSMNRPGILDAQLYLYSYHRKPLCKVELVSSDVPQFNATIRDSMSAYGFVPDVERITPDEEGLRITSSASFVTKDEVRPIRALILYFEEHRQSKVSLTIYADE